MISDVKKSTWGKIKALFRQESGYCPPTDQLPHTREPVILVLIAALPRLTVTDVLISYTLSVPEAENAISSGRATEPS